MMLCSRIQYLILPLSIQADRLIHCQHLIALLLTWEELKMRITLHQSISKVFHPTVSQITRWIPFPRELKVLKDHHIPLHPTLLKLKLWETVRQLSQMMLHSRTPAHPVRSTRFQRKPEVWSVENYITFAIKDTVCSFWKVERKNIQFWSGELKRFRNFFTHCQISTKFTNMNRKNLNCSYLKNIIRKNTLHFYRFLGSGLRVFDQSRQITSVVKRGLIFVQRLALDPKVLGSWETYHAPLVNGI